MCRAGDAAEDRFLLPAVLLRCVSKTAQQLAGDRLRMLSAMYPNQLPSTAFEGTALTTFPYNVKQITAQHVEAAVQPHQHARWLLVANWPCEDLSPASKGLGLLGPRSIHFVDAIRVLGVLQQRLPNPPVYLLENTYML